MYVRKFDLVLTPSPPPQVYIDGGIRRGSDVLKAIALGAKAVGIGRPVLYGMAGYGQPGVEKVFDILRDEMIMNMRLIGARSLKEVRGGGGKI